MSRSLITLYPNGALQIYEFQSGEKCQKQFVKMMNCIYKASATPDTKIRIERKCKETISQWDECILQGDALVPQDKNPIITSMSKNL
jgi:hypothetical protein